jgi:transcriptional regulator with XRE-family HTH domain
MIASMSVSELFKAARADKGLSQQAVADAAGLSWSTVTRTEAGKLLPIGLSLFRMADVLGIPPEAVRLAVYESAGVEAPAVGRELGAP